MTEDLEDITDEEPVSIERSESMQKLLARLEKEDELFDYNVPNKERASFDDDELLSSLRKTYSQKLFVIEDEENVERYIKVGDRVSKAGLFNVVSNELKANDNGKVIDSEVREGKVGVNFENSGRWTTFLSNLVLRENGRPVSEIGRKLEVGEKVQYVGAGWIINKCYIPDKARGIVAEIDKDFKYPLYILWENTPQLVQKLEFKGSGNIHFNKVHSYSAVKLIRYNNINFDKFYDECFDEGWMRNEVLSEGDK